MKNKQNRLLDFYLLLFLGAVLGQAMTAARPGPPEPPNTYSTHDVHGHRPPPSTGRTTRYDFSEWTRQHYGATFMQDQQRREEYYKAMEQRRALKSDVISAKMMGIILFFMTTIILLRSLDDYDIVSVDNGKQKNSGRKTD